MASHSTFSPEASAQAQAHEMTKYDKSTTDGREGVTVGESSKKGVVFQPKKESPKKRILLRMPPPDLDSFGPPAVPSSITDALSRLDQHGVSEGHRTQVLQATIDYLGAHYQLDCTMLRDLISLVDAGCGSKAAELVRDMARTLLVRKPIPKLVFMKSCLPEHLKASTSAKNAAGEAPVEQRELPYDARRLIFQYMFQVNEPLCLDSPSNLRYRPTGIGNSLRTTRIGNFLQTTVKPFKGEDDNTTFDALSLVGRQLKHRKNIASFMGIFGTCKQISEEAGMVLYGANKLTFFDSGNAKDVLGRLSPRSCRNLHTLLIKFEAGWEGHGKMTCAIKAIHQNCFNVRTVELKGVIMEAPLKLNLVNDNEFESAKKDLVEKGIVPFSRRRLTVQEGYGFLEHCANHPSGMLKYEQLPADAVIQMTGYTKLFVMPYVQYFERHNSLVDAKRLVAEMAASARVRQAKAQLKAAKYEKNAGSNDGKSHDGGAEIGKAANNDKDNALKKVGEGNRSAGLDLTSGPGKKRKAEILHDYTQARKKRNVIPLRSKGESSKTESIKGKGKVDYVGNNDETEDGRGADDFEE